jgi:hypothetical protein
MQNFQSDSKLQSLSKTVSPDVGDDDKPSSSSSSSSTSDLLNWNNLVYTMPITNSVTTTRSLRSFQSVQHEYKAATQGTEVQFNIQTGIQYVDWQRSWLSFTLEFETQNGLVDNFDQGSLGCNWIETVILESRSGIELMRLDHFNRWRVLQDKMRKSNEWFQTTGKQMGYNAGSVAKSDYTAQPVVVNKTNVIVPMSQLGGFFDVDQLCPSYLASGLTIKLMCGDAEKCWHSAHSAVKYNLSNLKIHCDCHILNDASMKELESTSARNGLEYVYTQSFCLPRKAAPGQTVNVEISKAVSRALMAYGVSLDHDTNIYNVNNIGLWRQIVAMQWRMGSQYYPHQAFRKDQDEHNIAQHTLYAFDVGAVSDVGNPGTTVPHILAASFERSNLLKYSGLAINNSRTLSCEFEAAQGNTPNSSDLDLWVDYVCIAKVFLNNIALTI